MVNIESISNLINQYFSNPYIIPFIISMLPIAELRLSIPFGILVQGLAWKKVIIISVLGNFLIMIPVFIIVKYLSEYLMNYHFFYIIFKWIFDKTRKKSINIEKFKFYGLVLFVGIPLPLTGAWTGCIASYLINLSIKKTFTGLFLGICMSACIVTILTLLGHFAIYAN